MTEQRYALLIGNSEFSDESGLAPLRCPPDDVQGLAKVLEADDRGQFQVTSLINRTKLEIEKQLVRTLNKATQNDLVLIYFSGHGQPSNLKGQLYLAAQDTELSLLQATAIAARQLKAFIDDSRCSRIILILDCCYSGAIDDAFLKGESSSQVNQTLTGLAKDEGNGLHIMTASTSIQTAEEKQGDRYSVFTKHLINGISTGVADKHAKGVISFNDLFAYVEQQLKSESKQKPQVFNLGGGDLLIAHSGKSSRKDRYNKIRPFLLDLLNRDYIYDEIYSDAVKILQSPETQLTEHEKQRDALLSELYANEIKPAVFVGKWAVAGINQKQAANAGFQSTVPQAQAGKDLEPKMVAIPAGSFTMGSPSTEKERSLDEQQHTVSISAFYLGQTQVTKGQFTEFIAATNYPTEAEKGDGSYGWTGIAWGKDKSYNWRNVVFTQTDQHPVVCVSWNDAMAYIGWLNKETGKTYRLPTEAEWEYACRASTTTPFSFGDTITPEQVNYNGNYPYAGGAKGLYRGRTVAVKSLPVNPWGLYEMHGNVWEWCADWYGEYKPEAEINPVGPDAGSDRVLRGGSCFGRGGRTRSACRFRYGPARRDVYIGFRLALG